MDTVSPERRSAMMSGIRSKDTGPELAVRRYLHRAGLRYRLHCRDLPGIPDIVFRRRKTVVFVHGCFWHGCPTCAVGARRVKSNTDYWNAKVARNQARDVKHRGSLEAAGWRVLYLWECEAKNPEALANLGRSIRGAAK